MSPEALQTLLTATQALFAYSKADTEMVFTEYLKHMNPINPEPDEPTFELRHGAKILHTGTWEECHEALNQHAFKNNGMKLTRKTRTKRLTKVTSVE